MFRHHLFLLYDKIKTINASEPTYIENMIKSKKLLNMSLKSGKGHLKASFDKYRLIKLYIIILNIGQSCWAAHTYEYMVQNMLKVSLPRF